MSTIRLAVFNSITIAPAGDDLTGTTPSVSKDYTGLFEDGREINLGAAITANVDNNLPVPIAQEISLRIPLVNGATLITDFGAQATDHIITHTSTLAGKAKVRLNNSVTGGSVVVDNVFVTLATEIIEAGGEPVIADVLVINAKDAFGSLVTFE